MPDSVYGRTCRGTSGSLSATIGTFERLELAGAFDTRLGERAAMRWAGSMRRHDGYVDNTFTGTELFDEDTLSLRGHLQLTPTDRRRILLTVDATRDRPLGPARHIKALEEGNPARALWRVTSGDLTTVRSETDGFQKRDAGGLRLGIEDRVGGLALTSVTAYRRTPEHDLTLSAGLNVPLSDRAALLLDAHYRHVSELFGDNDNNLLEVRAARDEVDARAALAWGGLRDRAVGKEPHRRAVRSPAGDLLRGDFRHLQHGLTFRWTP